MAECYAPETVDAAIWTAIGLLAATSLGTLFYLGSRIDAQSARIDGQAGRTDALSARIDALIGVVEGRFDRIDARFDSLEARIDTHLGRHAG